MLTNLFLTLAIGFAVGLNGIKQNNETNYHNNDIEYKLDGSESEETSYPIYNDVDFEITLSAYQLNNYSWQNLLTLEDTQGGSIYDQSIFYNSSQYEVTSSDYTNYFTNTIYAIYMTYDNNVITELNEWIPSDYILYHFYFMNSDLEVDLPFEYNLKIVPVDDVAYEDYKTAIQADVLANQPANNRVQGDDIITAITSGLGLIGDLAKEFLNGFSTLFWDNTNNQLTDFGTFSLVFLGVAITMAVVSLALALIKGNTGA